MWATETTNAVLCSAGLAAVLLLSGCAGAQSVMQPAGAEAADVVNLAWLIFIGGGLILALVLGLTAYAIMSSQAARGWVASEALVVGGGVVFPVTVLSALLIHAFLLMGAAAPGSRPTPLNIAVSGEQFWWRVTYRETASGTPAFSGANELHIPTGSSVTLTLTATDVIHSFWVPRLAGKLDMIPGQANRLVIRADEPGVYRGQCAEYCGQQHALMAFHVIAHRPEDFERWQHDAARPALEPQTPLAQSGRDLFLQAGCGGCHAVRGTAATGTIGPDLTHMGARQSIAAGTLPNTPDALSRWIGEAEHIKPGNKMPPFAALSETDRQAIATYLSGLR